MTIGANTACSQQVYLQKVSYVLEDNKIILKETS